MSTAAIVVTYFPDEALLIRLLSCICSEAEKVYVIDNTPAATIDWLASDWFIKKKFKVLYKSLGENLGIAKAQNIGINFSKRDGCDHIIFFDQDSAPPKQMIQRLLKAESKLLTSTVKVGSIGPIFIDEKTKRYAPLVRNNGIYIKKIEVKPHEGDPVAADHLIASGSLIRLVVLEEVGLMNEDFFIDWVDIEWGLRAGDLGYMHYVIPDTVMLHSIGDQFIPFGKQVINLHNDIRNYYIIRNACNLLSSKFINWQWRLYIFFKIPRYVIFYSITTLSKKRPTAFILLLRACADGFKGRLGKAF